MEHKYCKFNKMIYEVCNISKDNITLKKNNYVVHTKIENVEFIQNYTPAKTLPVTIHTFSNLQTNEIMLRHMTKEEAISTLDKFVDSAIVNKIGRIKIIHGRHGGILRKAVHEYLSNHPNVKEFFLASYGEGDVGVTIAILGKKN